MATNIYLIGLPGSGKSTVGNLLAQRLGRTFVDLDEEIIKHTGETIVETFNKGEEAFRQIETDVLKTAAAEKSSVIATGGGVVIKPENMDVMTNTGKTIYLKLTPEQAFERMAKDQKTQDYRPQHVSDAAFVKQRYEERKALYPQANVTVDATKIAAQVVDEILEKLQ